MDEFSRKRSSHAPIFGLVFHHIIYAKEPLKDKKWDASQNKLKNMWDKKTVQNPGSQIETQMKNYAKLTKGDTVFTLDTGYWLISPNREGGYAWARIRSDGKIFSTLHFSFLRKLSITFS